MRKELRWVVLGSRGQGTATSHDAAPTEQGNENNMTSGMMNVAVTGERSGTNIRMIVPKNGIVIGGIPSTGANRSPVLGIRILNFVRYYSPYSLKKSSQILS